MNRLLFWMALGGTAAALAAAGDPTSAYAHAMAAFRAQFAGRLEESIRHMKKAVEADPASVYLKEHLQALYLSQRKLEEAGQVAAEILREKSESAEALAVRGAALLAQRNYAEALPIYRRLYEQTPDNDEIAFTLGAILNQLNRNEEALKVFEKFLAEFPEHREAATAAMNAGLLLEQMGRPAEAEARYRQALARQPDSLAARLRLAELLDRSGRSERREALAEYEKALGQDPSQGLVWRRVGEIRAGLRDFAGARSALERAAGLLPRDPLLRFDLGRLSLEERNWAEAARWLEEASRLAPDSGELWLSLGFARGQEGKAREAEEAFARACRLLPKEPEAWYFRGLNLLTLKRWDEARRMLEKVTELAPNDPRAFFQLGALHERRGRLKEMEKNFRRSLALQPDSAETMNYLGYAWADRGMNLEEAKQLIEQAVKIEPDNGAFLDSLGWVLFKMGRSTEAIRHLERARGLEPDPVIWEHCGDVYMALGREKAALESYRQALWRSPESAGLRRKAAEARKRVGMRPERVLQEAFRELKAVKTLAGEVSAQSRQATTAQAVEGRFYYRQPDRLRVEILGLFSVPQAVALFSGPEIRLVTADGEAGSLSGDLGWTRDLMRLLAAETPPGASYEGRSGGRDVFRWEGHRLEVDPEELRIVVLEWERRRIRIQKADVVDGVWVPRRIEWTDRAAGAEATVELRRLSLNRPLPDSLFLQP